MNSENPLEFHNILPISVSYGDPSGVGCEIILKSWLYKDLHNVPPFFAVGSAYILQEYNKLLQTNVPIIEVTDPSKVREIWNKALPILNIQSRQIFCPGKPNIENSKGVIESIEVAIDMIYQNHSSAITTCPISKKYLYDIGFPYPGHTESLAHISGKKSNINPMPVMLLKGNDLAVVPTTIHIPLKEVFLMLNKELIINTAKIIHKDLINRFDIKKPRIAVAGLNPHAGENGTIGSEEQKIIIPAINDLISQGINVSGPFPADTMFTPSFRPNYDVALCIYHDQALIPLKTINFDNAVNITLGLPVIRTSPDHGTAFDIAGKNIASPLSFINALKFATIMVKNNNRVN